MADRPPLRDVIARYELAANKALGQNFLLDAQLLARIARVPGDLAGQSVYEVGPGPGGLTRALIDAGARVTAVEADPRCLAPLGDLSAEHPGQLRVLSGDALKIPLSDVIEPGGHIVANLPYNVGSALFVDWLSGEEWPPRWGSLTLMFQREVADRIIAAPDTKAYGRLSVLAQWRCNAVIAFTVHRSAFVPPPKVMSAVVHLRPRAQPAGVRFATLERLTAAAFGQRRKMLRQSVKGLPRAITALDTLGIDTTRRAETLSPGDFVNVARLLD